MQVRDVHPDKTISTATIANVGVGEVFVGAGQSNSTNFAQFSDDAKLGDGCGIQRNRLVARERSGARSAR